MLKNVVRHSVATALRWGAGEHDTFEDQIKYTRKPTHSHIQTYHDPSTTNPQDFQETKEETSEAEPPKASASPCKHGLASPRRAEQQNSSPRREETCFVRKGPPVGKGKREDTPTQNRQCQPVRSGTHSEDKRDSNIKPTNHTAYALVPVNNWGYLIGMTTASFSNLFASSSSTTSVQRTLGLCW